MLPIILQMMLYGFHVHVMVVVQRALGIGTVQHDDVVAYSSPAAAAAISAPSGQTTTAPWSTVPSAHDDDVHQRTDTTSLAVY